jgi:hypothetical protein
MPIPQMESRLGRRDLAVVVQQMESLLTILGVTVVAFGEIIL